MRSCYGWAMDPWMIALILKPLGFALILYPGYRLRLWLQKRPPSKLTKILLT